MLTTLFALAAPKAPRVPCVQAAAQRRPARHGVSHWALEMGASLQASLALSFDQGQWIDRDASQQGEGGGAMVLGARYKTVSLECAIGGQGQGRALNSRQGQRGFGCANCTKENK